MSRGGNDHLHAIGVKATMHSLRHRALTVIYQATNDAFYTADIAGHSSTEITRIYAKPDHAAKTALLAEVLAIKPLGTLEEAA